MQITVTEFNNDVRFKISYKDGETTRFKTLDAQGLYLVLQEVLDKENVLYDTGYMPKEVISVSETTNSKIVTYHFPLIEYDFHFSESIPPLSNVVVRDQDNGSVIRGMKLRDVIFEVTAPRGSNNVPLYKIYHRMVAPGLGRDRVRPEDLRATCVFANYYNSGSFCWGTNQAQYNSISEAIKNASEIDKLWLYPNVLHLFLGTRFNNDLTSTAIRDRLNSHELLREYYGDGLRYVGGGASVPLAFNYLAEHPEDIEQFTQILG